MFLMRGEPDWEAHREHFERVLADPAQRVWAVLDGDVHVGNAGLKNLSPESGEAELWIYVGEEAFRSRGVGTAASRLLLEEGFEGLSLRRIRLHVADFNEPAVRMYRRLGFVETGTPLPEEWRDRECSVLVMEKRRTEDRR
jgi:RimJ/RimL family protein N-acetyltransferase